MLFAFCSLLFVSGSSFATGDKFISCGGGYVLEQVDKISGIESFECKKLWCMDLENGKIMGAGDRAAYGYTGTKSPVTLETVDGRSIECFGARKWCKGQIEGIFNPEYGVYTQRGSDTNAYLSVQKGDCFSWSVETPDCKTGESVVMINGQWTCAAVSMNNESIRQSSIRRTSAVKKIIK